MRSMPGVIAGVACTSICGAGALAAYAVRGPSSTLLAPSVYRGSSSQRAVALTFDDGPSESTPALLDLLEKLQVTGTFFQCGANVQRLPQIARQVVERGHELGNHSHTHPRFYFRSREFIGAELAQAQDAIRVVTGVLPRLFRAPFGVRWPGMGAAQRRLNLLGVMWTVIGCDWKLKAEAIFKRVLTRTENGAIIGLHDGRELEARPNIGDTIEAVKRLIPALENQGYRFETVSQLICPRN